MVALERAARAAGAVVLERTMHSFSPEGFTAMVLLSESHATIHTYPEHRTCFVDLFTCGLRCRAERFDSVLREWLSPASVVHRVFLRDTAKDLAVVAGIASDKIAKYERWGFGETKESNSADRWGELLGRGLERGGTTMTIKIEPAGAPDPEPGA
jgi:S-adenosylmethionine decarboxylase proenzyme